MILLWKLLALSAIDLYRINPSLGLMFSVALQVPAPQARGIGLNLDGDSSDPR